MSRPVSFAPSPVGIAKSLLCDPAEPATVDATDDDVKLPARPKVAKQVVMSPRQPVCGMAPMGSFPMICTTHPFDCCGTVSGIL